MQDQDKSDEGLGQSTKRTVTEAHPLRENTLEALIQTIQEIISAPGSVKAIHIQTGEPVQVERIVGPEDDLAKFIGEDPTSGLDFVRARAQVHEYIGDVSPHQQIWEMFLFLVQQGLQVNRVLVGSKQLLSKWLASSEGEIPQIFGAQVDEDSGLPESVILVCGGPFRISPLVETSQAIKGVMG